jgi:hypothetical protein
VPSTALYLDGGDTLHLAGDGGGPRVVRQDATGAEEWSVYVADPDSRLGVNSEAMRLLLAAAGERVLSESEAPAEPKGVDPAANGISRGFGLFDSATIGVGILFDVPPADTTAGRQTRAFLPQDVWTEIADRGGVDPYSLFVAVGDEVSRARQLPRYIEVQLIGPGPWDLAGVVDEVMGKLT